MDNLKHKCNGCRYKSEHQEMGFRPFGVCTKETNLIEAEKAYKAEVCPYKQNEEKRSEIKWVNRPISAQYATVTDENGEKHYGKVHDIIENNLVGYCGECGKRLDDNFMNFCPNCGAKMKGE